MTTISDFYQALADLYRGIEGISVAERLFPTGTPVYPAVFIHPPRIEVEGLGNSMMTVSVGASLFVSAVVGENALTLLEYQGLTGDKSVHAAIQANRSLGLAGVDVFATSSRPFGIVELSAYNAFGCQFEHSARIDDPDLGE
jgi:hypothetical protein